MADRSVSVRLAADISNYVSGMAKAAAATELTELHVRELQEQVDRTNAQVGASVNASAGVVTGASAVTAGGYDRQADAAESSADRQERAIRGLAGALREESDRIGDMDFDEEGDRAGGKLAQGINAGLIRNSPMIVAGVAGALTAGAPVVLAGAGLLFAGIGAVAAAQLPEVAAAWTELGQTVKAEAVSDAAVLAPAYEAAAEKIGAAFEELRPQLRAAFADTGPMVDSVVDGVIALATNAMPGLVRAVQSGQPVFDALQDFLGTVGNGLTGFFDAISTHGQSSAQVLDSIGDILGGLLPTLGELLGTGADVAGTVLPMLASALGGVESVLHLLQPILPEVLTGLLAYKAVSMLSGPLSSVAGSVGGMGTALRNVSAALPLVGIAVGVFGYALEQQDQQARQNTQVIEGLVASLQQGGSEAQNAAAAIDSMTASADRLKGTRFSEVADAMADSLHAARQAADDHYNSLTLLERGNIDVTREQNDLNLAIDTYGQGSPEAVAAAGNLAFAQNEVSTATNAAQIATTGLTQAIADQAQQALAAADANLGYRDAVDQTEQAEEDYATAVRDHGAASEEADDASRALEQSMIAQATAAGNLASSALPATTDALTTTAVASRAQLQELYALRDQYGTDFPASLQTAITQLEQATSSMDQTTIQANVAAGAAQGLGLAVTQIPGSKYVQIDAPTAQQEQQLHDLGYTVTHLPDGRVVVTTDTAGVEAQLDDLTRTRYVQIVTSTVGGSTARATQIKDLASGGLRASGGPVWPGDSFWVGEEGPELVTFAANGVVTPAAQSAALAAGREVTPRQTGWMPQVTAGGASTTDARSTTINVATVENADRIARVAAQAQADQQFLVSGRVS